MKAPDNGTVYLYVFGGQAVVITMKETEGAREVPLPTRPPLVAEPPSVPSPAPGITPPAGPGAELDALLRPALASALGVSLRLEQYFLAQQEAKQSVTLLYGLEEALAPGQDPVGRLREALESLGATVAMSVGSAEGGR